MMEVAGKKEFFYFVDKKKYDTTQSTITGAQIKAAIPNFDPSYSLFLEAHGDEPDKLVNDTDSFALDDPKLGTLHFYTVPPATFGKQ